MKRNVGGVDAFMRFVLGVALIFIGMYTLEGIKGNPLGIIVALISLMPIYMAITRKCFVFKFLQISTVPSKDRNESL